MLHDVPLDPLLRPRLSESLGPPPAGLILVQLEELSDPGRAVLLAPQSVVRGLRLGSLLDP